ncbi:hypothetical protein L6164_022726 [Bauhinia variegata]|uniref:Uncharacterized protein n=1 Tax=Bauhinia variegata TaxID=167791 RepID=A0ACB9MGG8_BAUVA|nr:hypothetical protein L6164_022726 [Bauhinia variegata]
MGKFLTTKICNSCPKIFSLKIEDSRFCQHCHNIVLSDPSSASEATFEISGSVKYSYPVCMLFRQFHQMRCLRLDIEIPIRAIGDFKNLPEFSNMCQLQIGKASRVSVCFTP